MKRFTLGILAAFALTHSALAFGEDKAAEPLCPALCTTCTPAPVAPPTWQGQLALGYSLTGGNTVTESFTPALHIARNKNGSNAILGATATYGEYNKKTTQENGRGALLYRKDFGEVEKFGDGLFYWGGGVTGMYDKIAKIDYRVPVFLGAGVHLIDTEIFETDFEVAPGHEFEHHNGIVDNFAIYRIGNFTRLTLSKTTAIEVDTDYTALFENSNDWVVNVSPTLSVMMTPILGLNLGGWYRNENIVAEPQKKEDWIFGASLTVNFASK